MKLFLDSGAFVARHSKNDVNHAKAVETFQKILEGKIPVTRMYTSDYVFAEAVTVALARTKHHSHAVELGEAILNSKAIEILRVEDDIFNEAWEIFKAYKEQGFSFVDCTSFALMKKKDIKYVFSFDRHFDAMGFVRI